MTLLPNPHPGDVLLEDFLKPMEITQYRLAESTGMPHSRVTRIVHGEQGISPDTALRLSEFFGTSARFWLGLQMDYDLEEARREKGKAIHKEVKAWVQVGKPGKLPTKRIAKKAQR